VLPQFDGTPFFATDIPQDHYSISLQDHDRWRREEAIGKPLAKSSDYEPTRKTVNPMEMAVKQNRTVD